MQNQAYDAMHHLQARHWWWRGMRRVYAASLRQFVPPRGARRVIDVGCGFGANLSVLNPVGAVVGIDLDLEALQAIRERPALGLVQAHADALPFRAGIFDVIGLLAVIEHVEHDGRALREARRVARPGAILLLLTSAFMVPWSHHDVANYHRRRYRRGPLKAALCAAGWTPLRLSYINALIFPAVLITRLIQRMLRPPGTASFDMGPDLGPFNYLLEGILAAEGTLVTRWRWRLPFGVDLLGIARCDG